MRLRFSLSLLVFAAVLASCANATASDSPSDCAGKESISVVNWNVQTFFDSTNDGSEYSEFNGSKTWGKDAYVARVSRLCSVIRQLDADVFIMEELENEAVLHDISNFLAGEWNAHKIYSYGCFAKDDGSSIGCGVLSRYPLSGMTLHAIGAREASAVPRMRPLMEFTLTKDDSSLVIFVNHWKSMSGGAEETEVWRNRQEAVLARRMESRVREGSAVLAAGDFNRDINSFCITREASLTRVFLRGASESDSGVQADSFWFHRDGTFVEPGSYFFRGEWSRIDQIFACGGARISECRVCTDGPWCDEETSVPKKYTVWNGSGYSDHLPIMCRVWF